MNWNPEGRTGIKLKVLVPSMVWLPVVINWKPAGRIGIKLNVDCPWNSDVPVTIKLSTVSPPDKLIPPDIVRSPRIVTFPANCVSDEADKDVPILVR